MTLQNLITDAVLEGRYLKFVFEIGRKYTYTLSMKC